MTGISADILYYYVRDMMSSLTSEKVTSREIKNLANDLSRISRSPYIYEKLHALLVSKIMSSVPEATATVAIRMAEDILGA